MNRETHWQVSNLGTVLTFILQLKVPPQLDIAFSNGNVSRYRVTTEDHNRA